MSLTRSILHFASTPKSLYAAPQPLWSRTFVSTSRHLARQRNTVLRALAHASPEVIDAQTPESHDQSTHSVNVNRLLRPVGRQLTAGQPIKAKEAFERAVAKSGTHSERLYNSVILLFLRFHYLSHAHELYNSMSRECVPSTNRHVVTWMEAFAIASNNGTSRSNAISRLTDLVKRKEFTETGLLRLLRYLTTERSWDESSTDTLIESYLGSDIRTWQGSARCLSERALKYIYSMRVKAAGDWEKGAEAILKWSTGGALDQVPRNTAAYTALLHDMPVNKKGGLETVLETMRQASVSPDASTYGALIGYQVKRGRYDKALTLYAAMKEAHVAPDASTFVNVFYALGRSRICHTRGKPTRREKTLAVGALPSARQILRDALFFHSCRGKSRLRDRSPSLNTAVLNAALFQFMAEADYAGALVAARTFKVANLQPTLRTYKNIVVTLARRMEDLAKTDDEASRAWLDAMLRPVRADMTRHAELRNHLLYMQELLALGSEASLNADDVTFPVPERSRDWLPETIFQHSSRGIVPSVMMLIDLQEESPAAVWDVLPLVRILRRALAASIEPSDSGSRSRGVSDVIRATKAEIVPSAVRIPCKLKRHFRFKPDQRKPDETKFRSRRLAYVHI